MADIEIAIVGAGVVGLACAATLARRGRSVLVIERHSGPGQETSIRNSGVIHAGLHYPTGSLKARTCVAGRRLLYERCERLNLPHQKCGKLVVAADRGETEALEALCAHGLSAGAEKLEMIGERKLAEMEPEVRAKAALWSPETGIVDVHALMKSYQAEAARHGAQFCFHTRLIGLGLEGGLWRLDTENAGGERSGARAGCVVNAAGLEADRVAELAGLDVEALDYRQYFCKGDYFSLAPSLRKITRHLIYPIPLSSGLGIHITFDLGGRYLAGPDVEYVSELTYSVNPVKAEVFARAVSRFLPRVRAEHLSPDYAGIRPKLQGLGESFRDFVVEEASRHGAPGLVNLLGIESPGLTASEAIALEVARLIEA